MATIKISDGLKIGNQYEMNFLAVDSDGVAITNLADATEILFMIKENTSDDDANAIISKKLSDMTIDNPTAGYITFFINSPDWDGVAPITKATKGSKPVALQINYSTDNKQEVYLKEEITDTKFITTIKLIENIIKG